MKTIHHGQNVKTVIGFANSLRDYQPKLSTDALKSIKKELLKWKKIEATTPDNDKLDEAQKNMARLEREAKRLSRQTIDSYRTEYQKLSAKFNEFELTYHKKLKHDTDGIKLHYHDGGFDAISLVIRDDAKKIYDELVVKEDGSR